MHKYRINLTRIPLWDWLFRHCQHVNLELHLYKTGFLRKLFLACHLFKKFLGPSLSFYHTCPVLWEQTILKCQLWNGIWLWLYGIGVFKIFKITTSLILRRFFFVPWWWFFHNNNKYTCMHTCDAVILKILFISWERGGIFKENMNLNFFSTNLSKRCRLLLWWEWLFSCVPT